MAQTHTVQKGEDLLTIAREHGLDWRTVWEHADNRSLREERDDPFALAPGDVVALPEKTVKYEPADTGTVHRFRRRGAATELRLKLFRGGRPRIREAYTLEVDGASRTGTTGADGRLVEPIPVDAQNARLTIGPDEAVYELQLGQLPPLSEPQGVQARLNRLGFDCGREDGTIDEATTAAVRSFQMWCGLDPTGEIDAPTRQLLHTHSHAATHDR